MKKNLILYVIATLIVVAAVLVGFKTINDEPEKVKALVDNLGITSEPVEEYVTFDEYCEKIDELEGKIDALQNLLDELENELIPNQSEEKEFGGPQPGDSIVDFEDIPDPEPEPEPEPEEEKSEEIQTGWLPAI